MNVKWLPIRGVRLKNYLEREKGGLLLDLASAEEGDP